MGRSSAWWVLAAVAACGDAPDVGPDAASDSGESCSPACDDGLYCNGLEQCEAGRCAPGAPPCARDCDEAADACDCTIADSDGDGYDTTGCDGDDCDDADATRNPGAPEVCDTANVDEDCDPTTLGGRDIDADGFVDALCCNGAACGDDCDDATAFAHPGEVESCDARDNDCDMLIDEGVLESFFLDRDADLHGVAGDSMMLCAPSGDYRAPVGDDCNDSDSFVWTGAPEVCDLTDNDCDTMIDEDARPVPWYVDEDLDGWGSPSVPSITSCTPIMGRVLNERDCDDTSASVSPAAMEICNGVDDDCSTVADDAFAVLSCGLPFVLTHSCTMGACGVVECAPGRGDCDATAPNGCEIDTRTSIAHCGACDSPCTDPFGTPFCASGTCDVSSCVAGYHACARRCVSDSAVATCGTRCSPCPEPASDGVATCDGLSCGIACDSADFVPVGAGTPAADCLWNDPTLVSIVPSGGALSPAFDPGRTSYDVAVPLATTAITLTATARPGATVTILIAGMVVASGVASPPIALAPGTTTITVQSTAESGFAGRGYQIRVTRGFNLEAYVKASNTGGGDGFGRSVAIDGDTMVIGAAGERSAATGVDGNQNDNTAPDSGAVYVFVRSGSTWMQEAYIKASNTGASDYFGLSVAISGDTIVVGAYGEDSAATGVDGNQASNAALDSGAAYVFVRGVTGWAQEAYLKASNTGAGDNFGYAVGIDGDRIAIGARYEDSAATGVSGNEASNAASDAGAAYFFERTGSTWAQDAYVKASNAEANDYFGTSIGISGGRVVVGAPLEDSDATGVGGSQTSDAAVNSGAAYVFVHGGAMWSQEDYLKASNTESTDEFGHSVAISTNTIVVGAPAEDSAATGVGGAESSNAAIDAGAAYVFERGTGWAQDAYLKASNTGADDSFGVCVAIDGSTIIVGASREDGSATGAGGDGSSNASMDSGAAYAFARTGGMFALQTYIKASNTGATDRFGTATAVTGDSFVIGAIYEDSADTGVGGSGTSEAGVDSGAAYVYIR